MNKQGILALCCMLVLSASCKKSDEGTSVYKDLLGTWEWVRSEGGLMGAVLTPQSEGYSQSWRFLEPYVMQSLKDGWVVQSWGFTLEKGKSFFVPGEVDLLKRNGEVDLSLQFPGKDSLVVREECIDCFAHTFVRKQ